MRTKKILWVFLSVLMLVMTFSMTVSADLAQNTPDGATAMLYCVDENGNTLATYYYWGTSWTSFTETAPSITGYTPEKTSIKITHGLIFTKEYTLKYTRNSYKLTIYYKYANGSTAATTHTSTVKYGDYYSISSPSINGYSPSDYSIYGTMRASDTTKTVTYTPKSYTVTVNYQYANGKTAATSQSKSGVNGTSYSFTSPTISGYTPSQAVVSGTIDGSETITVTYKANPVTPKYTLTINYVYATGGTASSSYTATMESGSSYSISSPTISGYTADKTAVSGTLTSNTTVTVTYTKNPPTTYTLTIYYKYDSGGTAATTYKTTLEKGSSYSVISPSIRGYSPDKYTVSGTLTSNKTVTVYYTEDIVETPKYTLTIYYKYADGTIAATTYSKTMDQGSTYSVTSPTIANYTANKSVVSGTLSSDMSVTVTYSKNQYTLTIYYKYADGTTAATAYTKTMDIGSAYNVSSPTISNYHADKTSVSGTLNADTNVTVYYSKDQYTLTIYYKYTNGTTAATTYTGKMNVGSSYSVPSPTIEDYVADKPVVSGTLSGNKSVTVTYSARTPDVSFEGDGGSGNYTAGTTVISSFTVKNGAYNIKPMMNCDIAFRAYYIENSTQKTVATDTWDNFVIPKNEEGLVYFMWDAPESLAGKTVYCEISYGSQTISFSKTVKAKTESQVPNTRYETEKPSGFTSKSAGSASRGSAEWEIWEYEGGSYEKVKYTLSISADVEIKPDSNSFSAVYENGKWTMRSGYGYTISVKMNVSATSGADYTKGQCASAYLPEYKYSKTKNEYCTLELVDDTFQFATNTASAESARIVFMPVWYPDGGYTVKVVITDVWTPAGVVSVTGISNTITVSGTVFDDFYVGA